VTAQLVIFDCDGVLVDSETIACRVDAQYLTEIGFPTTEQEALHRYLGRSVAFMRSDLETRFGRPLPDDFSATMHERTVLAFSSELKSVEGIAQVVAQVPCKICVASSSTPERIERALRITGLWERFHPHIFSATQVKRGKPAPDLFLFAAEQMSIAPSECVVIEDSPAGIEAARAAKMRVIGFTGGSHCGPGHAMALRMAGATETAPTANDLAKLLNAAKGGRA